MRINRFLASTGAGSRRSCEQLVLEGRVRINGEICQTLATDVNAGDDVRVDGRVMRPEPLLCLAMHKPPGYLCTRSDEKKQRRTIYDLLPADMPAVVSIGRLDMESEGLLLLTNDGALNLQLTHPRFKVEKEYEVTLDKSFQDADIPKLLKGMMLEEGRAKAERVIQRSARLVTVILKQGLKRQIRNMFYRLGYEVTRLRRVRIGPILLGRIPSGKSRRLTPLEIRSLTEVQKKSESGDATQTPAGKTTAARRVKSPQGANRRRTGTARPPRRKPPGRKPA